MTLYKNVLLVCGLFFTMKISFAHSNHVQSVNNAGVILINNYLPPLLERAGITINGQFPSSAAQERCVLLVQYTASGVETQVGNLVSLNKVLCGLRPDESVNLNQSLTQTEIQLVNSLLSSMISYWPALGQSTIDSLRENFLMRSGFLSEDVNRWTLSVETRSYDILLSRSPFSFSLIKYPWMEKVLLVSWPY